MSDNILKERVLSFLKDFKKIASKEGIYVVPRSENTDALVELGYTKNMRFNDIMSLSVGDYYRGPESDRDKDRSGDVWEFGKSVDGKDVYIKLKIAGTGEKRIAKCISFHLAQYPMRFPLR